MSEEFYSIALRKKNNKTNFFWKSDDSTFNEVKLSLSSRYWIADPFLVEHDNSLYMYYELFDYFRCKGVIAFSKINNGVASKPEIIIEEKWHLSFPYIWEEMGDYYIMPESSSAHNLAVYKSVDFPRKWVKQETILSGCDLADSIMLKNSKGKYILSSSLDYSKKYFYADVTNVLYKCNGKKWVYSHEVKCGDDGVRNAGAFIIDSEFMYRPGQISTAGEYGKGLAIWQLDDNLNDANCCFRGEKDYWKRHINMSGSIREIVGVHTYNTSEQYEIIDFKYYRDFTIIEKIRNIIGSFPYKVRFHLDRIIGE